MKDLSQIEFRKSTSASNIYNSLKNESSTSLFEAKRTLEAIDRIQAVPILTRRLNIGTCQRKQNHC